jgi:uridine kinase
MGQIIQPYSVEEAADEVLKLVNKKRVSRSSAAPVLIGISGIDCSGKSTLADALAARYGEHGGTAALARIDDFIIPRSLRKSSGPLHIDYFNNTFDRAGFAAKVNLLAQRTSTELVIGEGVFLFSREMAGLWQVKVWIEMSPELAVERGAARDASYFGSAEQARDEYLRRFIPAHEYHLKRDKPAAQADLILQVR